MAANLTRLLEQKIRSNKAATVQRSVRLLSSQQLQKQQQEANDDEGKQAK